MVKVLTISREVVNLGIMVSLFLNFSGAFLFTFSGKVKKLEKMNFPFFRFFGKLTIFLDFTPGFSFSPTPGFYI